MDGLAGLEAARNLHQFALVDLSGATALITELSRDPPSVYNNGSTFDLDRIVLGERSLHRHLTTFVTVEWVNNIEASYAVLGSGDEDLLAHIELAKHKVRLELVVNSPLRLGHAPPSEVQMGVWCAVDKLLVKFIVGVGAQEGLLLVETVLGVSENTGEE